MLKEKLEKSGVNAILTKDWDQDVSLDERCAIANTAEADLFVSIHCNSYTDDTSIKGFEGYYYQDTEGKRLADLILCASENYPSIKTRSVKEEDYKVLRDTEMPAVLLKLASYQMQRNGLICSPASTKTRLHRQYLMVSWLCCIATDRHKARRLTQCYADIGGVRSGQQSEKIFMDTLPSLRR